MTEGPIEKVLRALDELGKIIKAQEDVIAEKDTRIKYLSDKLDFHGIPFGHPTEGDRIDE